MTESDDSKARLDRTSIQPRLIINNDSKVVDDTLSDRMVLALDQLRRKEAPTTTELPVPFWPTEEMVEAAVQLVGVTHSQARSAFMIMVACRHRDELLDPCPDFR